MKLELFYYLLEVNRLHSISAASRSLHIGQTTLSAAIKTAETELGYQIFARTPSGVEATPAGERFMEYAWNIFIKYDELVSLKDKSSEAPKYINILVSPSLSSGFCVDLSSAFLEYGFPSSLTFRSERSSKMPELILSNTANIGIAYFWGDYNTFKAAYPQLEYELLLSDIHYAYMNASHPLAGKTQLTTDDFCRQHLAVVNFSGTFSKKHPESTYVSHTTAFGSTDLALQAISEQDIIGIFPGIVRKLSSFNNYPRLTAVPIRDSQALSCVLIHKPGHELRYQEKIILKCVKDTLVSVEGKE